VATYGVNQVHDLFEAIGFINVSGNILSAPTTNLTFAKSAGFIFAHGSNYINNVKDPHKLSTGVVDTNAGGTFQYRYQDGSSGALTDTLLIPGEYDDGNGQTTPGTVSVNKWTCSRVFLFTSNAVKVQPGQYLYNSSAEAIGAISTEGYVIEPSMQANGLLIGYITLRGGATNTSLASDCQFFAAGKFGISTAGVAGGTSSLQQAYDNSGVEPEILTDSTRGAVTIKRGSAADANNLIELQNGAGTTTFAIDGNGDIPTIGTITNLRTDDDTITVGKNTVNSSLFTVCVGNGSTIAASCDKSVAIGHNSGVVGAAGIAIGENSNAGLRGIAIGLLAGDTSGSADSIAIGNRAGQTTQAAHCVAIGEYAGNVNQGRGAIAIGTSAGVLDQHDDSIVINASYSGEPANAKTTGSNQIRLTTRVGASIIATTTDFQYNGNIVMTNAGALNAPTDFTYEKGIGELYWEDNTTATVITLTNTWYKVLGTSTANPDNTAFTHTNNRLTYTGTRTRIFHCGATIAIESPANTDIEWSFGIRKNGTHITGSKTRFHTVSLGDHYGTAIHVFAKLATNDYIELELQNNTNTTNVEVSDINMFILGLPNSV
jgi:hypothetical protein